MSAAEKRPQKTKPGAHPALPRDSSEDAQRPAPMEADFPGTPLEGRAFYGGKVITWDDQYTGAYDWDAGVAIAAYLDGLKDGKLLASYSLGTDRTVVPPRTFDELSWTPIDDLRELPGTGTVNTFSLSMVNWDASRRDEPQMPAVIELDGASPGMGILHMLDEVEPDDVEIGMKVEAVWKPAGERRGAITDILYFRPLAQGPEKGSSKRMNKTLPRDVAGNFRRDFRTSDARSQHGDIPIGHKYTMGVAGEEFFQRLRDQGEISATLHQGNDTPSLPPRLFDTDTFAPIDKWVKVGPGGTVETFTVYGEAGMGRVSGVGGEDGDDGEDKEQRILAMIRVDGANGGLVHWIGGCDADEVEIGMRVRAVIEPKNKRIGALSDIRHFAPFSG